MAEWFVYSDKTCYPRAETVEAPTAEAAARVFEVEHGDGENLTVFPWRTVAYRNFVPGA